MGSSSRRQSKNGEQPPPPRAALHYITNDSPIVGLGHDGTPRASAAGKTRARPRPTPRSGEALLRGQVKTLLQKFDEEVLRPVRIHALLGVSRSPAQLLEPTPANTPQLGVESAAGESPCCLMASRWRCPASSRRKNRFLSCRLSGERSL